jgi:UPF0716 family protein affecting phage T7 exclusion
VSDHFIFTMNVEPLVFFLLVVGVLGVFILICFRVADLWAGHSFVRRQYKKAKNLEQQASHLKDLLK